jgi:hypothetical protein
MWFVFGFSLEYFGAFSPQYLLNLLPRRFSSHVFEVVPCISQCLKATEKAEMGFGFV